MRLRATLVSPAAASPAFEQSRAAAARVGDDARLQQQTGWHSPVPYLFGGLAAMLGLIAFALLILACSYWKLSGHLDSGESDAEAGGEGEKGRAGEAKAAVWESKVLVIMAGQVMPTFLATPSTSRSSSFGDTNGGGGRAAVCDECGNKKGKGVVEEGEDQVRRENSEDGGHHQQQHPTGDCDGDC